ncbi:MAG: hypothetical protein ACFFDU_02150 [Candidatus Thorarchaeota archaeon]
MASSNTSLIVAIIVGFIATLGIAYGLIYATAINLLPIVGPGLVPGSIASTFNGESTIMQVFMIYHDLLLNILVVYILAPAIWLIGGLIAGLISRDMVKGAAAGLIMAMIAPFLCYGLDFLLGSANSALLLTWVLNGLLAGLIAAVGGVIGGTLTSQFEAH